MTRARARFFMDGKLMPGDVARARVADIEDPLVGREGKPVGLHAIGHTSTDRAYVATGHSVWGMLNAPATGEAISELILDGAASRIDLAPFAPGRLPPLELAAQKCR